jgi:cation diffusion facilitator family transporter
MAKESQMISYKQNSKIVLRVTLIGIAVNVVLTAVKLAFGIWKNNLAVMSDAATSGADLFTSLLIVVAIFVATPRRNKTHNYGREKIEPLVVLFLSLMLVALGGLLLWQGIDGIINPIKDPDKSWYLIAVTVFSIIVKEFMYFYGMHYAKKTKSEMVKADAKQSRSDSLSSVAVLAGLITSYFIGTNIVESIAVVIVSLFVFKVAFDTFKPAFNQLTDRAASKEVHDKIVKITLEQPGVINVYRLRTRIFGSQIYAELEITVDATLTVAESYAVAGGVHDILEATEELRIKDVVVVVKPG